MHAITVQGLVVSRASVPNAFRAVETVRQVALVAAAPTVVEILAARSVLAKQIVPTIRAADVHRSERRMLTPYFLMLLCGTASEEVEVVPDIFFASVHVAFVSLGRSSCSTRKRGASRGMDNDAKISGDVITFTVESKRSLNADI